MGGRPLLINDGGRDFSGWDISSELSLSMLSQNQSVLLTLGCGTACNHRQTRLQDRTEDNERRGIIVPCGGSKRLSMV